MHAARWCNSRFQPDLFSERYNARLQWLDGSQRLFSSATTVLLFAVASQVEVTLDSGVQLLGRYDCLHLEASQGLQTLNIQGRCCLIELSPR